MSRETHGSVVMRILTGIVTVTALVALASPALADFYVVNDGSSCRIVETATNAKPDSGNVGEKHLTQADAEAARAKDPNCKKEPRDRAPRVSS